ncbi:MAG TPA: hypothetical protein VGG54_22690 [Trebonia sp.]
MQAAAWDIRTELLAQLVDITRIKVHGLQLQGEPHQTERPAFLTAAKDTDRRAGLAHALSVLQNAPRG